VSEAAVRIESVTKRFGDVRALDGVSFTVPRGTIFGLLGPNGAGKTTLFSIMAHFLHANAGRVEVLGVDVRNISRLRGRMTILPQDALFQRNVPIVDQLAFFRRLDGSPEEKARAEVLETLERVGLAEYSKRGVHALSHGMIKRLGLAQAFLGDPEVILLDEPTSGLDPKNAVQIRALVKEFQSRDATIVYSSHNLAEIEELCDHVAILDRGKVVAASTVADLTMRGRSLSLGLSRPLSEEEGNAILALPGVTGLSRTDRTAYTLTMDLTGGVDPDDLTNRVLRQLLDASITPRLVRGGASIEKAFLDLTES
jgi:ABC-type multidrug transport system ATPase subunit